jgi:predicted CXXCH cytochrome family protein
MIGLGNMKYKMRLNPLAVIAVLCTVFLWCVPVEGGIKTPSHMDSYKQPEGCKACHRGRGVAGTPMLRSSKSKICFDCHGSGSRKWARADIESEFNKRSRHRIYETEIYHSPAEILPETSFATPRHISCYDCHVVHISNIEKPLRGTRGYAPGLIRGNRGGGTPPGLMLRRSSYEFELCYLCHSDSANLPEDSTNIAEKLNPDNESYHPVEMEGRSKHMPSLVRQLTVDSKIMCGDCHGNEDPRGPKGPHGSEYEPILVAEYRTEDGTEFPKVYELCYMCHDRRSILGDESFSKHNWHIVQQSTSCHTCHDSHGSETNERLISFNEDQHIVGSSNTSGGPTYIPVVAGGTPKCYLSCHGVEHSSDKIGDKDWPW